MSVWSKEDLEEMCGDDIVEQLAFLSGCHQHELCNGNPSGWIIPDEVLRRFAELIVSDTIAKIESVGFKSSNDIPFEITDLFVSQIKQHFGVK